MGTKTILQIVNEARIGTGLPAITQLYGATARKTRTVEAAQLAILETIEDFLVYPWSGLETLATINTVASTESYVVPADYNFILTQTYWSQGSPPVVPGIGPMSAAAWRTFKNLGAVNGVVYPRWRVQGSNLIIFPVPTAVVVHQFDYISNYIVYGVGGYVWGSFSWGMGYWTAAVTAAGYKAAFTVDTDTFKLSDALLRQGVRWRLLKSTGKPYAVEYEEFRRAMDSEFARDNGGPGSIQVGHRTKRPLVTSDPADDIYPIGDATI